MAVCLFTLEGRHLERRGREGRRSKKNATLQDMAGQLVRLVTVDTSLTAELSEGKPIFH